MQGAAAVAEVRRSRASPDKADESAKKPRLDLHVKQEAAGGGDGGAIVAAAAYSPRVELTVRIDKSLLDCPLCTLPFKRPVFQCKQGHLACGGCVAQLPCGQCKACADGGGFFDPCPALDAVVSSTRVECPNAGCQRYVTYHEAADHQSPAARSPAAATSARRRRSPATSTPSTRCRCAPCSTARPASSGCRCRRRGCCSSATTTTACSSSPWARSAPARPPCPWCAPGRARRRGPGSRGRCGSTWSHPPRWRPTAAGPTRSWWRCT